MMVNMNQETEFKPDQWDSVFEDIEREQDEKEEREKQEIQAEKDRILQESIDLLEEIEKLLNKGLRHEMPLEFKVLLGKGPEGFCGGRPDTNELLFRYGKEEFFRVQFRKLCEKNEIDKKTYKIFLKRLYPRGTSDALIEMRTWLKNRIDEAPYCPLKKPGFLFITIILLLTFGYQLAYNLPPLYAVFPTFLVGVHYGLYRLLYPKYGGPGSHVRISMGIMFVIFFYGERIASERINPEGVYMMATTYIDIFFTTGLMCLPGLLARASRKKDKQRETENRHMQKEGI